MEGRQPSWYEFFCGGGMARAGLGPGWNCLFANDIDPKKAASYAANWGDDRLRVSDVAALEAADLPGHADLAWASFPCQDLSLAGNGAGLDGQRSGAFWAFWHLMQALIAEGRAPQAIVLENVCGVITSHRGRDFAAIVAALVEGGYFVGALVIDAKWFVPQSRPRLFFVATRGEAPGPAEPDPLWHPQSLVRAVDSFPPCLRRRWVWRRLPVPAPHKAGLAAILNDARWDDARWHAPEYTARLLSMMSARHRTGVESAGRGGVPAIGCVYRRTRVDAQGNHVQRAEIRFDNLAGCLRTPAGGSSRQTIMVVEGESVRSRLLTPRECARLMGLPERYRLPANYNDAYHLLGDGVVVPAVRYLSESLLWPIIRSLPGAEDHRGLPEFLRQ
jgi:DNA (cytosine-5)-methyltransferase 1